MAKKALSIGINYPGTSNELRGCVNDSLMVEKLLRDNYGFTDITLLLDNDATTANMRAALHELVKGAVPGDILFFHYSGHGSQIPDKAVDDDFEPDGMDEIICPVDLDWRTKVILDDELKAIFDSVPNGVNLTVFLDCCNSGGGLDQLNEYQALAPGARQVVEDIPRNYKAVNRFITPPNAVLKFAAEEGLKTKTRHVSRKVDSSALMISGCQSHQTSADAYINGTYRGAATFYLDQTLRSLGYDSSYVDVVDKLNKDIAASGFTQRPQLDGAQKLHDKGFLSNYAGIEFGPDTAAPVPAYIPPKPPKKDDDDDGKKKKSKTGLMIGVVVAIIAAVIFATSS